MTDPQPTPAPQEADEVNLLDLLVVLSENARLLIYGSLAAGLVALGVTFLIPPTYTAVTKILPPQERQSAASMVASQIGVLTGVPGAGGIAGKGKLDTYAALLKSRSIADRLIDRFNLLEVYDERIREVARKELSKRSNVVAGRDGLMTIEVEDQDPKRAADLANAYVEELSKLTDRLAITEAQQRRAFFEKQFQRAQENLRKAQVSLAETGAGESILKSAPQAVVEGIAKLRAQVTAQEIKLSVMRGYLTETSPEFQLAQRELSSLRAQLSSAEQVQPAKNGPPAEYLNRFREFKYSEALFELMAKEFEIARLDEARESAVIQIVDVAVTPETKSKPKRVLVAVLTTIVASILLLLYVLLRRAMHRIRDDPVSARKLIAIISTGRRLLSRRKTDQ